MPCRRAIRARRSSSVTCRTPSPPAMTRILPEAADSPSSTNGPRLPWRDENGGGRGAPGAAGRLLDRVGRRAGTELGAVLVRCLGPGVPTTASEAPDPPTTEPLVIAVHVRRPPADLSRRQAGLLLDGGVTRWSQLGAAGRPRSPSPASPPPWPPSRATPSRSCRPTRSAPASGCSTVDGVDPLRDPDDYPIQVAGPAPRPGHHADGRRRHHARPRVGDRAAAEGDPSYPLRPMAAPAARRPTSRSATSRARCPTTARRPRAATRSRPTRGSCAGLRAAGFDALVAGQQPRRRLRRPSAGADRCTGCRAGGLRDRSAPAATWPRRASRRWSTRNGVRFGFLGLQRHRRDPRGRARVSRARSSVSMPPRTGPLDRAELAGCSTTYDASPAASTSWSVMPHWGTQYTDRPEPIQDYVARRLVARRRRPGRRRPPALGAGRLAGRRRARRQLAGQLRLRHGLHATRRWRGWCWRRRSGATG